MVNKYTINLIKGDTYALAVKFKNLAEDLDEAFFTVKDNPDGESLLRVTLDGGGIVKVDDRPYKNEKTYKIQLESSETATLEPSVKYVYDFRVVVKNVVQTIMSGTLVVDAAVTPLSTSVTDKSVEVEFGDEIDSDFSVTSVTFFSDAKHSQKILTYENLNDLFGSSYVGWYYSESSNTVTNKPTGVASFGLEIGLIQDGGGESTYQKLYPYDGSLPYYRMSTSAGGNWTSWKQFASSADIPTVNNGVLTIQKNGVDLDTFSANQSENATINIEVPTSDNYVDLESDQDIGGIKTFNGNVEITGEAFTVSGDTVARFENGIEAHGEVELTDLTVKGDTELVGELKTDGDSGEAGQFLMSKGSGSAPAWVTLSTASTGSDESGGSALTKITISGELSISTDDYNKAVTTLATGNPVWGVMEGEGHVYFVSPMNVIMTGEEGVAYGISCLMPIIYGAESVMGVLMYYLEDASSDEISPRTKTIQLLDANDES